MSGEDEGDLEAAVSSLYAGPLDEFVSARDALVKRLRAADWREEAKEVKALRKPSRTAWALNSAHASDPAITEEVSVAVADVLHTQSSGGDLRAALDQLREAVRVVAAAAARIAADAGHPLDQATFSQALSAVVADTDSLQALRAGRLSAVPTSSSLDLLTSLPSSVSSAQGDVAAASTPTTRPDRPTEATGLTEIESLAEIERDERVTAQAAVRSAETTVAVTRRRSAAAESALQSAERSASAADDQLRLAERQAANAHAKLDRARQEADAAQATEQAAEKAATEARERLARLEH